MSVSYVSDISGATIAVQIPINEWNDLKKRHPDVENIVEELPDWQKQIIDNRLEAISKNPDRLRPIHELFDELESNED